MAATGAGSERDGERAKARILDSAEELFYARGVQAVGMDAVRSAAGVSLKRLYQLFPAKERLVEEFLRRRDHAWRDALVRYADARPTPRARLLAVFDWLYQWFAEPDFRGCVFINCFGELGGTSQPVAKAARDHKEAVRAYLGELTTATGVAAPQQLASQLALLAEGAITTAALSGSADSAREGRVAAEVLLNAAGVREQGAAHCND
ncbi:TetR/AcrR family transcriptional regulator [Streptomyces zagrosensis]|uniref:AcrR family transcriptional regulator n=1 Tax=Streptomyces zagrosensis TaxID=1042984 RepID=A0A7W9QF58_9ACTN|nr:TetR/AcrR family transcriptional regulator [Streptomyces zagrosensis]MBB5939125.1 AcrR family transcriptional regulator [Streptomyces zagrosensis]